MLENVMGAGDSDILRGEVLERQLSYWKAQLAGLAPLRLSTGRPWPAAVPDYAGASQQVQLSAGLTESLKALSRREGVTLFITLLAVFQVLLSRYSGQDDIAVGSPTAGRTPPETEGLIGSFVNMLVLRTDLSGDPTFCELLGRVREVCLGAYAHQDVPFEKLVEVLEPEGDRGCDTLVPVVFAYRQATRGAPLSPKTESDRHILKVWKAKLRLTVTEEEGQLSALVHYAEHLHEVGTIKRFLGHYQTLLTEIVANPARRFLDLPLLTKAERHQLLVEWNSEAEEDSGELMFIHQLFEKQVDETPYATAAVYENASLTYRELDNRANQVAHCLRKLGVGPNVCVGISIERSLELPAAVLGILKAGGACVPLDPNYPRSQLEFMLEETQLAVLLSQQHLVGRLPGCLARVVCVGQESRDLDGESTERLPLFSQDDSLGFVFYTSGSTGRPKGVMWSQPRSTANNSVQRIYQFDANDRHLLKSPLGFTLFVRELFWPLLSGGTMFIVPADRYQATDDLVRIVRENQITILNAVPSLLRSIVDHRDVGGCGSLRHVVCLGESLPAELERRVLERLNAKLSVFYGTTEAPGATFRQCGGQDYGEKVVIGRPLGNKQVFILDTRLQPAPIGVAGEICIGGNLALGYLNNPELNKERFIRNPFSTDPEARLYRTGDLARYLPNGEIEYLGRQDNQVKVRGVRIELGQIEAVLDQHTAIRQAVVAAYDDGQVENQLVAYVAFNQTPGPTVDELRAFLGDRLPDYMMPSRFILLKTLPLTPNGKIDRKSLPVPGSRRPDLEENYVAPRGLVEQNLVEIWEEVLGIEGVGVNDGFLALGGSSLSAARVASRINEVFEIELPLRRLFESQTIAALSGAVSECLMDGIDESEWVGLLSETDEVAKD